MARRQLYALPFFDDDLQREGIQANRQQARQSQLTDGPPQVRFIASEPGERRLRGHFDGLYADVMGSEMRELLAAGDIRQVPYYVVNESVPWEGYYAPSRTDDADRAEPTTDSVQSFDGVLDFEGTNASHLREVSVSNSTVTNPFGNASTQTLFLANTSTGAKWISQQGDSVEDATVQNTFNGEREDFDEFDATEPAFAGNESYALVYDIPYDDEWQSDPTVWDDHDRNQSIDGIAPTWARVYDAGHAYNGSKVVETGRMRLLPVPATNTFTAQQWNDTSSQYENVSLGSSDWQLTDFDIRRIGLERVRARTGWENSSDTTQTYELEAEVLRGQNETHFYEPENANSSTPSGLVTLLDPIAMDTDEALGEETALYERADVPDE